MISGAMDYSDTSSNLSSLSSHLPLMKFVSRDSLGHRLTMIDVWISSGLHKVSSLLNSKFCGCIVHNNKLKRLVFVVIKMDILVRSCIAIIMLESPKY